MTLGSGKFAYEEVENWTKLPAGWDLGEVPSVAVDSTDRVFFFCRAANPVVIVERDGTFLRSWGEGVFSRPHMITIGPDNSVYCVDDVGHRVRKFTPDGELLLTLKPENGPTDTGYTPGDSKSVKRAGPPFNKPTDVDLSPEGEMYVTDGYGNARVHKFDAEGKLLFSWGEPGSAPGQFEQVHGVCVDPQGLVYVADRKNTRIQIFSPQGEFLRQWTDIWWPCAMCLDGKGQMYVAEVGGVFMFGREACDKQQARITVRDLDGNILSQWQHGLYFSPHDIAVDSSGALYVGEVVYSYTYNQAPPGSKVWRKYARI